jgi:xanthine/uracil permease
MLLIVVITRCFRGFISQIAVLLSIAIGALVAWPMGLLDFSSTHSADWVGFNGSSGSATRNSRRRRSSRCASSCW